MAYLAIDKIGRTMEKELLTQITQWAKSATYISKNGNDKVKNYTKGYEQGIADAKARVLEIVNQVHPTHQN